METVFSTAGPKPAIISIFPLVQRFNLLKQEFQNLSVRCNCACDSCLAVCNNTVCESRREWECSWYEGADIWSLNCASHSIFWWAGSSLWELQHVLQVCVSEPPPLAKLMEKAISPGEREPGIGALNSHKLCREQTVFPVSCKPFAWVTCVTARQKHRKAEKKGGKELSASDCLKNQWGPMETWINTVLPAALCSIPATPKDAFVPFLLSLKPSSEDISQQECTLGQPTGWSMDVFFPYAFITELFFCACLGLEAVCLLLHVVIKAWWLISCLSLWEDISDITCLFKPTDWVPQFLSICFMCLDCSVLVSLCSGSNLSLPKLSQVWLWQGSQCGAMVDTACGQALLSSSFAYRRFVILTWCDSPEGELNWQEYPAEGAEHFCSVGTPVWWRPGRAALDHLCS